MPLSPERIVTAAIEMADREGFEAVTLRRLAASLGVHVTSLYNHIETRDALVDGMVDRLVREAELPCGDMPWEGWVRGYFENLTAVAAAHPGAFYALMERPVQTEAAAASFEAALRAFTKSGLGMGDSYGAIKATTLTALAVGMERTLEYSGRGSATDLGALPADRFPLTVALKAVDNDAAYSFMAETLVAGLRSQLRRARSSRPPTTRPS